MDGTVSLLDASNGELLHSAKPHMKYVVSLAWAGDGRRFVSGSWDSTMAVHSITPAVVKDGTTRGEEAVGVESTASASSYETLQTFRYTAQVQSVVFLADGNTAVVAVRDSNYLRLVSVSTLQVCIHHN